MSRVGQLATPVSDSMRSSHSGFRAGRHGAPRPAGGGRFVGRLEQAGQRPRRVPTIGVNQASRLATPPDVRAARDDLTGPAEKKMHRRGLADMVGQSGAPARSGFWPPDRPACRLRRPARPAAAALLGPSPASRPACAPRSPRQASPPRPHNGAEDTKCGVGEEIRAFDDSLLRTAGRVCPYRIGASLRHS